MRWLGGLCKDTPLGGGGRPLASRAAPLRRNSPVYLPVGIAIFDRVARRSARFWSGSYPVKGSRYCCFPSGCPGSGCPKTSGESPKKAKNPETRTGLYNSAPVVLVCELTLAA